MAAAFTALLVVAMLWQCDRVIRSGERLAAPSAASAPPAAATGPDPAPVFMIVVDSLRYQTAMDPVLMPTLARLRRDGAWARMNTIYQGHTVPALRALFTGGMPSGVFNVVSDFRRSDLRLASLFSELRDSGRRSAAWSSGQFAQFGDAVEQRFVHPFLGGLAAGDVYAHRDGRRVEAALANFAAGQHALTVAHIEFTDYAAHEYGTAHPDYRRAFARADAMVADALRRLPPGASVLVVGDHGHDERGAHKAGLDIPTAAFFRGPAFRPGFALGTIETTDTGYLLHAALRQPVNRSAFPHAALDRALAPGAEPPPLGAPAAGTTGGELSPMVAAAFVLLAGAAWRLWREPAVAVQLLAWAALGATLLPGPLGAGLAGLLALGAGLVGRVRHPEPFGTWLLGAALAAFGTLLVHAPGTTPPQPWLARALLVATAVAVWRRPANERPAWLAAAAALALWLGEPWLHAAGWLGGTLCAGLGVVWLAAAPARRAPWAIGIVAGLALVFASFHRADATGHWSFAVPRSLGEMVPLAIAAGAAKLFLFGAFAPATWAGRAVALLAAVLLGCEQWFVDRSVLDWHERILATALVALFGSGWLAARAAGARAWTPLLGLAALFALFYHGVRAQPYHFAWADLFFAGCYLASTLAPNDRARAWLGTGGVALAFGLVQGWLPGGVEWQALYDWFPAGTVESRVGWFLPWILFRQTLAFWIVRTVILRGAPPGSAWPGTTVAALVAAWILGLALVRLGHFAVAPAIETVQIPAEHFAGLLVLLFAALAGRTRTAHGHRSAA